MHSIIWRALYNMSSPLHAAHAKHVFSSICQQWRQQGREEEGIYQQRPCLGHLPDSMDSDWPVAAQFKVSALPYCQRRQHVEMAAAGRADVLRNTICRLDSCRLQPLMTTYGIKSNKCETNKNKNKHLIRQCNI